MAAMNIIYILQVLIGFGFVIAIHEAGHFFAAKRVGITCPAFSIGFPFPVWTRKGWKAYNIFRFKWRGTEYRLGWIPFGGYVTMHGQSDSPGELDKPREGDEGDYRNKSYWQKTQVLLGGVTMNAITAVIGFIIAFQVGVTFIEPTVGMVSQTSQAWIDNKIQVGDRITEVNGREVVDFEDVVYAPIFDGGDTIDLKIEREVLKGTEDGRPTRADADVETETVTREVTLTLEEDPTFGLKLPPIKAKHRVILTEEEAARFPESLGDDRPQEGDEILAIDGRLVRNAQDAAGLLEVARGDVELKLQRGFDDDARSWTVSYEPRRKFFVDGSAFKAGVSLLPSPYVDHVRRGGAAWGAGLKRGDRIVGVVTDGDEQTLNSIGDLTRTVDASGGNSMTLVIDRDGESRRIEVTPHERESRPGRYQIGVTISPVPPGDSSADKRMDELNEKPRAWGVRPESEAARNGLAPGDRIVGIKLDGEDVKNPETGEFDRLAIEYAMLQASSDDGRHKITFEVRRDGGVENISVTTDPEGPDSGAYMLLGAAEQRSDPVTYGLGESVMQGFYHSKKVGYKILMTLSALFTGQVKPWHLAGPVVIAKRSYSLAQWGPGTLIFFLAFISINLAIINLIPLPVLDGGQWLIVTIEAIRGKPLPERAMNVVGLASFILVVGLMLFVLANDIITVVWRGWV